MWKKCCHHSLKCTQPAIVKYRGLSTNFGGKQRKKGGDLPEVEPSKDGCHSECSSLSFDKGSIWFQNFQGSNPMRRAILYVPGDDDRKVNKALKLDVDCIALDCEDGVAVNRKEVARLNIRKLLDAGNVSRQFPEWSVRINSTQSEFYEQDLNVILGGKYLPPTILLPKVDSIEHVAKFADSISCLIGNCKNQMKLNLVMFIESARAILNLPNICRVADELSHKSPFTPVALVFGSDDLCANLGVTRSTDATEILYARQKLVLVAKAFGLQAIDMVHIDYKDLEELKKQSVAGSKMGYTGKQVIHPGQIPIVHTSFMPSADIITWAEGLISAFHSHQAKGKGAFTYKGQMIDMPLLRQAENIITLSNKLQGKKLEEK